MLKLKHLSKMINFSVIMAGAGLSAGLVYAANSNLSVDELNSVATSKTAETPYGVAGLGVPKLVMLTMGREHNLFSEAYSDYTDIDGDGKLDIMFDPSINYYGIFESKYCYEYSTNKSRLVNAGTDYIGSNSYGYWVPVGRTDENTKEVSLNIWADTANPTRTVGTCPGKKWSGNYLNYVTSSRIDVMKRVMYGGTRFSNNSSAAAIATKDTKPVRFKDDQGNFSSLIAHSRVLRDAHAWGKVLGDGMYEGKLTVNDFTEYDAIGNNTDAYFFAMFSYDWNDDSHENHNAHRWLPFGMRVGKVQCAGMPGVDSASNTCGSTNYAYIWDWVSRQTANSDSNDAIASKNQKRIDANGNVTGVNLFVDGKVNDFNIVAVSCTTEYHESENCKNYGTESNPVWQPIGFLQQYGEGERPPLKFGLVTGSWKSNMSGGALRANIDNFSNEIYYKNDNSNVNDFISGDINVTGVPCTDSNYYCGIIPTLDRFSIYSRNTGDKDTKYNDCERNVNNLVKLKESGSCKDWGNPIGSILYQSARYFQNIDLNDDKKPNEDELGIGYVERKNPVENGSPDYCTAAASLVIADENISFDSPEFNDQINGGDTGAVKAETQSIKIKKGKYFVGGIAGKEDTDPEFFIPSIKEVSNLAQVIGIAPGVAYSYGSYNVAGVAKLYGQNTESVTFTGPNNEKETGPIRTLVVAMQPNVPQINIPITGANGKETTVSILPFAKTVADLRFTDDFMDDDEDDKDGVRNSKMKHDAKNLRKRQSTNQVADFYVETLGPDHGVFRINYEDFQYGSDYDMDWVVEYKYQIINSGNDTYVRVQLKEIDSDAYAPQHAGYVITGVEHSGVYVDLAKSAYDHRGRAANLYELDNVIGDSAILGCSGANSSSLNLKNLINNYDNCLFATYNEDNYEYEITNANVANYYKLLNSNGVRQYYYGNRSTIEKEHGWNICASNNLGYAINGKCRLIGDCYRRFDKCASKSGRDNKKPRSLAEITIGGIKGSSPADQNYTSSRLFKVNNDSADNYWLKTPLWYAAKFGLENAKNDGKTDIDPQNYYLVTNATKLRDGIIHMLNLLDDNYYSGSSFVLKGTTIDSDENPYAYATVYGPKSWYGNLVKVQYDKNYQYTDNTAWEAFETFAYAKVEDRLIVTNDYFNNRMVRLYADDIAYKSSPASSEYQSYASSSKNSGALKYIGYDLFRTIINENVSDEIIDGSTAYLAYVDKLIRWMNGESTYEGNDTSYNDSKRLARNNNAPLRQRLHDNKHYVLGDIINSDAVVFDVSGKTFVAVGANDGMIHIVDDRNGNPVVSYVPSVMLSSLGELVKQNYTGADHRAFVDSTPKVFTEKSGSETNVYLYGTYGLGFKGGYVLNMNGLAAIANMGNADEKFDQISTGQNKMLVWEMTEALTLRDKDGTEIRTMGSNYIGKQRVAPSIILKAGIKADAPVVPYLVFGSGYDHESENAGIVLVDMLYRDDLNSHNCMIEDGESTTAREILKSAAIPCITRIIPISEGESDVNEDPWGFYNSNNKRVGRKNVIAPVSDYTSSSINEFATNTESMHYGALYFGDLFGRVWKIDLSELDATATDNSEYLNVQNWGKENTPSEPQVIFRAVDANDVAQPITTSVAVGYHPQGGIGLIFGTGSLWTVADRTIISKKYNESQSLYMIRDMSNFTGTGDINASDLAKSGYPVRRCNPFSYAETEHCLIPLVESEHKIKKEEKDSTGNKHEVEYVYRKISVDPSIQASSIKNIYGWYFDLNGFDENDKGQARIYVDPQVISSKYMSVAVNIPDFSDSCDDKGSSYIIRGNWSTNPTKIEIYTTVKLGYQVNSGNLYLDSFGRLVDIYQGTPAHANHPDETNSSTWNNRISKTSSWLKLY